MLRNETRLVGGFLRVLDLAHPQEYSGYGMFNLVIGRFILVSRPAA